MRLLQALHDVGPFFAYSPRIARAVGGPEEGLLLQFILWKLPTVDAEVTLTASDIEDGTGLTARRQERARGVLREIGVLVEERKGIPARLFYRIEAAWFDAVWDGARVHKTWNQDSTKGGNLTTPKVETVSYEKGNLSSLLEEHKELTSDVAVSDLASKPKRKAKAAQPSLPSLVDPEDVIAGKYDLSPDDSVLEATVRLWASVWSDSPSRVLVTQQRRRVWRDTLRGGAKASEFSKAILGMRFDNSASIDRSDYCDFVHVARNLDKWLKLFASRGDPRRQRAAAKKTKAVRAANGSTYRVPLDYTWNANDEAAAAMGYEWDDATAKWSTPSSKGKN